MRVCSVQTSEELISNVNASVFNGGNDKQRMGVILLSMFGVIVCGLFAFGGLTDYLKRIAP